MDRHRRVLGVSAEATDEEIKRAYREKVQEYHPDHSDRDDAEERFKRVKEAYDALLDEERGERESRTWGDVRVAKDYNTGWTLVFQRSNTGNERRWAVVGQASGDDGFRYIDDRCREQDSPYFFDDRETAERTYSEFRFERDHTADADADRDTEVVFDRELDTLWNLYRAERDDGERRWLVGARVEGSDHYVNADGEHQTDPHWFDDRDAAIDAHHRYVGADTAGPTTATGATAGADRDAPAAPQGDEPLALRAFDAIYRHRRAIKRYGLLASVGVAGYLLGAAGLGPAGGSGALATVGDAVSSFLGSLLGSADGAASGGVRGFLERHEDAVLPISAFYATVAAAYLIHRYLRGRHRGEQRRG